jgi:hypothetical protein
MTSGILRSSNRQPLRQGFILAFSLLLYGLAGAAELLKNGDFEQPLGPTNWTVGYILGGPDDFEIKDRTRAGSKHAAWFGGHFRPITQKLAHAYFGQTVTNLAQGHVYTLTGNMYEDWWANQPGHDFRDKFLVYIELIGGQGTPTTDGRFSVIAATDPDGIVDPPYYYPTDTWREFTAQQTPDSNGRIEVRLHYNKVGYVTYDKTWIMSGYFDDISLTP